MNENAVPVRLCKQPSEEHRGRSNGLYVDFLTHSSQVQGGGGWVEGGGGGRVLGLTGWGGGGGGGLDPSIYGSK